MRWDEDRGTDIARIANAAARHLGLDLHTGGTPALFAYAEDLVETG